MFVADPVTYSNALFGPVTVGQTALFAQCGCAFADAVQTCMALEALLGIEQKMWHLLSGSLVIWTLVLSFVFMVHYNYLTMDFLSFGIVGRSALAASLFLFDVLQSCQDWSFPQYPEHVACLPGKVVNYGMIIS